VLAFRVAEDERGAAFLHDCPGIAGAMVDTRQEPCGTRRSCTFVRIDTRLFLGAGNVAFLVSISNSLCPQVPTSSDGERLCVKKPFVVVRL
jgi:hypothetical protein